MISPIKPHLSDIFTQSFLLYKSGSRITTERLFRKKKLSNEQFGSLQSYH